MGVDTGSAGDEEHLVVHRELEYDGARFDGALLDSGHAAEPAGLERRDGHADQQPLLEGDGAESVAGLKA